MFLQIATVVLLIVAVIEIAWLVVLLRDEKDSEAKKNRVFVRFPGTGKEYALTERTIHELQIAGVSIIVEPNQ